jgi:hypothetical protein
MQTKRNRWIGAALVAGLGLGVSSAAMAHIDVGLDIGLPGPIVQAPPPPVYQQGPMYQQGPVYEQGPGPGQAPPGYQPGPDYQPGQGYEQAPGYAPPGPQDDDSDDDYGPGPAPGPGYAQPQPGYSPGVVVITPGWYGDRYYDGHRYWGRAEWQRRHPGDRSWQRRQDDRYDRDRGQ